MDPISAGLLLAVFLGLIPAAIATGKGRSFLLWWIFGMALLIIALPASLIIRPNRRKLEKQAIREGDKTCPYCAEMIHGEAVICRFCQHEQPGMAVA